MSDMGQISSICECVALSAQYWLWADCDVSDNTAMTVAQVRSPRNRPFRMLATFPSLVQV